MATLTADSDFNIAGGATQQETVNLFVLPAAGVATGSGRLAHPVLGAFDYSYAPDEWTNIDGDLLVGPIWSSVKTLGGGQNTLWPGHIKDVVCKERWIGKGGLSMPLDMLRLLISMWMTPPDPASDFIEWHPTYTTQNSYDVILVGLTVGGRDITLNPVTKRNSASGTLWVQGVVELTIKVVAVHA